MPWFTKQCKCRKSLQYRTHRLFAIYYHSHPWSCTIVVHIAGNLKTEKKQLYVRSIYCKREQTFNKICMVHYPSWRQAVDKPGHESTYVQNEHEIKPVFLAIPVQGKSPFNHSVGYSKASLLTSSNHLLFQARSHQLCELQTCIQTELQCLVSHGIDMQVSEQDNLTCKYQTIYA
jgi:hypothetical protein